MCDDSGAIKYLGEGDITAGLWGVLIAKSSSDKDIGFTVMARTIDILLSESELTEF